jgi:4-hydroxybenzoate polyprenyltransferase
VLRDLIRLARPRQWIKNGIVLLPAPFALADNASLDVRVFVLGLLGFCLITSAVYAFNDICDTDADRLHPDKRSRPLPSGAISRQAAAAASAALGAAGFTMCGLTGISSVLILASVYVAVNLAYSLGAKNLALVDVLLLCSGYVIRVLLGCALVGAEPSDWLLLCTSMLALFLAFGKRRADLIVGLSSEHRASLSGYNLSFLDQALSISAGIAFLSYALYGHEAPAFVEGRELAGLPFVAFGIFDYLRVVFTQGAGGDPVELAYRSRPLQLCVLGWALATGWSLGIF